MDWIWIVPIMLVAALLLLLAIHRVTHSRQRSGGEEQPTNSTDNFSAVLVMALEELRAIFDNMADSPLARRCYQSRELLEEVYRYTVIQVQRDFANPDYCRIRLIHRVVAYRLRQAWYGKVRNRRKRQLLHRVQTAWSMIEDDISANSRPASSIAASGCL